MSDTLTSLSLVTLAQQYAGNVQRQINRMCSLLKMIPIIAGEGKNVAFATEADGALAEAYSEGADASNFGGDAQDSAVLLWGLYRSNFHISQLAMDAAATTQTPAGNRALWARNLVNASAKLASTINSKLFNGAGTSGLIAGLDVAIGSATNTYASIDRSQAANAYFRPTVVDPGTDTAITMALLRDDVRKIYEASGMNPDLAMCAPVLFNKVGSLFDATRRQIQEIQTAKGIVKLDFGFGALELDGMMFVKDKDATTKVMYYLNTNHVQLQYLPSVNMSALPQGEVEGNDGFDEVPLGFNYEMIAKLGASERATVNATVQMVINRPNSCGVRLHCDIA